MASSVSYIFSTLEKFADDSKMTLDHWLRKFERCCIVAKKTDGAEGNVKGQLLLLYVEGRARAILEEFEDSQGGEPQTYAALVAKLKEHFESSLTREQAMKNFETRIQRFAESEEEFMLDLVKLYSLANPNHAADIKLAAIKRKFLNGISPDLRRNVFVFCNNPFEAAVTRENLLEYCRNARMHLEVKTEGVADNSETVMLAGSAGSEGIVAALNNLSLMVQNHVENTDKKFEEVSEVISVMNNSNRGSFRPGGNNNRGGGRSFRGSYNRGANRGGFQGNRGGFNSRFGGHNNRYNNGRGRGGFNQKRRQFWCYACQEPNHLARDCPHYADSYNNQGN